MFLHNLLPLREVVEVSDLAGELLVVPHGPVHLALGGLVVAQQRGVGHHARPLTQLRPLRPQLQALHLQADQLGLQLRHPPRQLSILGRHVGDV